ncbi:MAG: hypothetical protein LQ342_006166 [Letrouitia transgressa]|nr:MAG: hypothetical protein LQ342_006166 [Letrouitia transgressa]
MSSSGNEMHSQLSSSPSSSARHTLHEFNSSGEQPVSPSSNGLADLSEDASLKEDSSTDDLDVGIQCQSNSTQPLPRFNTVAQDDSGGFQSDQCKELRSRPPSTWRTLTAEDRRIAASLDHLRAKDLSVHLYNAFKLKRPALSRGWRADAHDPGNDGKADQPQWVPPKHWTAWPMHSKNVPREDMNVHSQWEGSNSWRPSGSSANFRDSEEIIQEILMGTILKKAKGQFMAREPAKREPTQHQGAGEAQVQLTSDRERSGAESMSQFGTAIVLDDEGNSSDLEPVVMADDEEAEHIMLPTVRHILVKFDEFLTNLHHLRASYATYETPKSSTGKKRVHSSCLPPRMKKEDSQTSATTDVSEDVSDDSELPTKLMSIPFTATSSKDKPHRKRQKDTEALTTSQTTSEEDSDNHNDPDPKSITHFSAATSSEGQRPLKRKERSEASTSSDPMYNDESDAYGDLSSFSSTPSTSPIRKRRKRSQTSTASFSPSMCSVSATASLPPSSLHKLKLRKSLALRDWSEILGTASLTAFPASVIDRAAARCANLFGEATSFRVIEEGQVDEERDRHYLPNHPSAQRPGVLNYVGSDSTNTTYSGDGEGDDEPPEDSGRGEKMKEEGQEEGMSADEIFRGVHVDGFMRPIKRQESWGQEIGREEGGRNGRKKERGRGRPRLKTDRRRLPKSEKEEES